MTVTVTAVTKDTSTRKGNVRKKSHPEGGLGGPVGQASGASAGGAPLQVSFADLEKLAASAMHPVENTSVNVDLSQLTGLVKYVQ